MSDLFLLSRNGGWCMHDEAAPHYIDMIGRTTYGHKFNQQRFNATPRIGWQIDPFGHSAVQAYLLGAEVGFDSLFFGRIDYQDRAKRKGDKHLEVIWRPSKSLGSFHRMTSTCLTTMSKSGFDFVAATVSHVNCIHIELILSKIEFGIYALSYTYGKTLLARIM